MEYQNKQRIRKSPSEQIADAKAALARAMQRQRASETRQKIVLGAMTHKWLASNEQAARAFSGFLRTQEIREQDKDALEPFMQNLITQDNG